MLCKKKDIKPARFDVLFCGYAAGVCAATGGGESTRSVPSRQGRTFHRKVTKFFALLFVFYKSRKIAAAGRRTVAAGNKKVGKADDNSRGAAELVAATTRKKSPQGGGKAAERQRI